MDIDEVIAIFLKLAQLSESETESCRDLCEAAVRSLRARLKSDTDEESGGDSLNRAAAALAFMRYVQRSISSAEESFKVGEISVSSSHDNSMKYADAVWEDAMLEVSGLLNDSGFVFGRIV